MPPTVLQTGLAVIKMFYKVLNARDGYLLIRDKEHRTGPKGKE